MRCSKSSSKREFYSSRPSSRNRKNLRQQPNPSPKGIRKTTNKALKQIVGVIGVSRKNIDESKKLGLLKENPAVLIAPNAIDPIMFYHYDRDVARRKLGFDQDAFIGIFVGEFSERKGSERVLAAAKAIPDLQLIMIGKGTLSDSSQIIFQGTLAHEEIVNYLNAADFFILPTLAEGCCNAIVEAMACGLPIISSDESFNDDLLDQTNSIRLNPSNVDEIKDAIFRMKDDSLRKQMQSNSLQKSKNNTIVGRCNKVVKFIIQCVGN